MEKETAYRSSTWRKVQLLLWLLMDDALQGLCRLEVLTELLLHSGAEAFAALEAQVPALRPVLLAGRPATTFKSHRPAATPLAQPTLWR